MKQNSQLNRVKYKIPIGRCSQVKSLQKKLDRHSTNLIIQYVFYFQLKNIQTSIYVVQSQQQLKNMQLPALVAFQNQFNDYSFQFQLMRKNKDNQYEADENFNLYSSQTTATRLLKKIMKLIQICGIDQYFAKQIQTKLISKGEKKLKEYFKEAIIKWFIESIKPYLQHLKQIVPASKDHAFYGNVRQFFSKCNESNKFFQKMGKLNKKSAYKLQKSKENLKNNPDHPSEILLNLNFLDISSFLQNQIKKYEDWNKLNQDSQRSLINLTRNMQIMRKNKDSNKQALYNEMRKDMQKLLIDNGFNKDHQWMQYYNFICQQLQKVKTVDFSKQSKFKEIIGTDENNINGQYQHKLYQQYPQQIKTIKLILEILEDIKQGDYYRSALNSLKSILKMDSKDSNLEQMLQKKVQHKNHKKIDDSGDIQKSALVKQANQQQQLTQSHDMQDQEQINYIIDNIELFNLDKKIDFNASLNRIDNYKINPYQTTAILKEKENNNYKLSLPIQKWSVRDIQFWRSNMDFNLISIEEIISVLDRAFQISHKKRLRTTQKASILLFNTSQKNNLRGHIAQILTGQGKTVITAFVAAVKVLQGFMVDVITSNDILAKDAVVKMQSFFKLLKITVADNNQDKDNRQMGPRQCYESQVVYGSMGNFQFDFLKDNFQMQGTMNQRSLSKSWILLDQVDNLIIDQGENIAKLSSSFPGMEGLRYSYINLWAAMLQLERQFLNKNEDIESQQLADQKFEQFIKVQLLKSKNKIIVREFLLPHLQHYAELCYQDWIKNCFQAKYRYHQNEHYRIINKQQGKLIIPVETNSGVSRHNTILSKGLHQFLSLKHNLRLSFENLTSCFISNMSYVKRYENRVLGLTGTLGSKAQRQMLNKLYDVDFSSIPPFQPKRFTRMLPIKVKPEEYFQKIAFSALNYAGCSTNNIRQAQISNKNSQDWKILQKQPNLLLKDFIIFPQNPKRSVLIICDTIYIAKTLHQMINSMVQKAQYKQIVGKIKLYTNEQQAQIANESLHPGDIIIATNISGRGTDLKTCCELQDNQGLHVIITFLPLNQRIQAQAEGRTSRQGNQGSSQIIINSQTIQNTIKGQSIAQLFKWRDDEERLRITTLMKNKVPLMRFKDQLFGKFRQYYSTIKQNYQDNPQVQVYLYDLKQKWAFWFNKEDYNQKTIKNKNVQTQWNNFKSYSQIKQQFYPQKIIYDTSTINPFYLLHLIDHFIATNNHTKASKVINKVFQYFQTAQQKKSNQKSAKNSFMAGFYIKFAQALIQASNPFVKKFLTAMKYVFGINQKHQQRINYLQKLKQYLAKGLQSIKIQKTYLQLLLDPKIQNTSKQSLVIKPLYKIDSLVTEQNSQTLKFLFARLQCLSIFQNSTIDMISKLQSVRKQNNQEVSFKIAQQNVLDKIYQEGIQNGNVWLGEGQIQQLRSIGLDTFYVLKTVYDVPQEVIVRARYMILGGIASIGAAFIWPVASPFLMELGTSLIIQGITDILSELLTDRDAPFSQEAYRQQKMKSLFITLGSCGIAQMLTSIKLVSKLSKVCAKISNCTQKIPGVKHMTKGLSNYFTKMHVVLICQKGLLAKGSEKIIMNCMKNNPKIVAGANKILASKVTTTFSKTVLNTLKHHSFNIVKNQLISKVAQKGVRKLLQGKAQQYLQGKIRQLLKENMAKEKLVIESTSQIQIKEVLHKSLTSVMSQSVVVQLINEMGSLLGTYSSSLNVHMATFLFSTLQKISKIITFIFLYCKEVSYHLNNCKKAQNQIKNQPKAKFSSFINQSTSIIYQQIVSLIVSLSINTIFSGITLRNLYKESKEIKKDAIKIQNQVEFVDHIHEQHKQTKCAIDAAGELFQIAPQQLTIATRIAPSQNGATISDFKVIQRQLHLNQASHFQTKNRSEVQKLVHECMKKNHSDRMIIGIGKQKQGHCYSIFKDDEGELRVNNKNGPKLCQVLKEWPDCSFSCVTWKNLNKNTIQQKRALVYKKIVMNSSNDETFYVTGRNINNEILYTGFAKDTNYFQGNVNQKPVQSNNSTDPKNRYQKMKTDIIIQLYKIANDYKNQEIILLEETKLKKAKKPPLTQDQKLNLIKKYNEKLNDTVIGIEMVPNQPGKINFGFSTSFYKEILNSFNQNYKERVLNHNKDNPNNKKKQQQLNYPSRVKDFRDEIKKNLTLKIQDYIAKKYGSFLGTSEVKVNIIGAFKAFDEFQQFHKNHPLNTTCFYQMQRNKFESNPRQQVDFAKAPSGRYCALDALRQSNYIQIKGNKQKLNLALAASDTDKIEKINKKLTVLKDYHDYLQQSGGLVTEYSSRKYREQIIAKKYPTQAINDKPFIKQKIKEMDYDEQKKVAQRMKMLSCKDCQEKARIAKLNYSNKNP